MSLPVNIDDYSRYIAMDDTVLMDENVSSVIIERLHRIRALYSYWLQFPSKFNNDIVQYDMAMFKVCKTQAYDDLHLTQLIMGNMQRASKEFMRWKIEADLEEDLKAARRAGDHRSVAAIEKNRILNNRTDKEDEVEIEFDKITPQNFVPTDDPSVIGIANVPGLRERKRKLIKMYSVGSMIQDAEYEEIEDGTDDGK